MQTSEVQAAAPSQQGTLLRGPGLMRAGMQTMIPVLLAPLLVGESWGDTPGSGAVLVAGFLLVAAGTAALAASPGVSQLTTGEVSSATEEVPSAAPATSGRG